MRILVCTDGSSQAGPALRFAATIARAAEGSVVVLVVLEPGRDPSRAARVLADAQKQLGDAAVGLVETRLRHGQPAAQILAEVQGGNYDLLVLGSRRARGVTRFMLGSTAERLPQWSPIPVLIVRGDRHALRRILVCTGGTTYGEKDAEIGGRIARITDAAVTVLHVMSQVPLTLTTRSEMLDGSAEHAMARRTREGQHLKRTLAVLERVGVTAQAKLRHGLVVDEILAEAREGDYDLIVVGAHMATGRFTFLLDDVCQEIIRNADRPVLVVRAPIGDRQAER